MTKQEFLVGMRINCVLSSMILTPMAKNADTMVFSDYAKIIQTLSYPFGFGEPNDVANMICYLLSDKARFISGQNYIIDSGGVV